MSTIRHPLRVTAVVLALGAVSLAGCGGQSSGISSSPETTAISEPREASSRACPVVAGAWGGAGLTIRNRLQRQIGISVVDPVGFYAPAPAFNQSAGVTRDHDFPVNICGTLTLVVDAGGNNRARIPMAAGPYTTVDQLGSVQVTETDRGWTLVYGTAPVVVGTDGKRTSSCPKAPVTDFTWSESSPLGGASNMKATATLTCDADAPKAYATLTIAGDAPSRTAP
jgi:hypothetical protein